MSFIKNIISTIIGFLKSLWLAFTTNKLMAKLKKMEEELNEEKKKAKKSVDTATSTVNDFLTAFEEYSGVKDSESQQSDYAKSLRRVAGKLQGRRFETAGRDQGSGSSDSEAGSSDQASEEDDNGAGH